MVSRGGSGETRADNNIVDKNHDALVSMNLILVITYSGNLGHSPTPRYGAGNFKIADLSVKFATLDLHLASLRLRLRSLLRGNFGCERGSFQGLHLERTAL